MPAHGKKKCTTPNPTDSTQGQAAPPLPDQHEFRQHLRQLARGAIRVVLEGVMRGVRCAHRRGLGREQSAAAKGIVTAPTPVIWSLLLAKPNMANAIPRQWSPHAGS